MDASQLTRKRLAEDIILLRSLNKVPGEEKVCKLPTEIERRQLSIEREKQLADDLAFLSATTDDMSKVMAVGIEEDQDGTGMTIRLASNCGDLSEIRERFEGIGDILQEAASLKNSRADLKPRLLKLIVAMDYARILSRLRSRHAKLTPKTRGRQPLITLLHREINNPSVVLFSHGSNIHLGEIRSRTNELLGMFENLELSSGEAAGLASHHNIVMQIVEKAHEMMHQVDLKVLLRISQTCDPCLVTALPKSLGKVGRYYSVSSALIDAARNPKYKVFNCVRIEILKPPLIRWSFVSPHTLSFNETLQRISEVPIQTETLTKARKQFESRALAKCASPWVVHAEIQLLCFYESNPTIQPPRMLCSSKSSCYLCHLFITIHGRFHVPSTHGTIYDKWMLPEWSRDTNYIISQLNEVVERRIQNIIEERKFTFMHPNESVLLAYTPWSSYTTLSSKTIQPTSTGSHLSQPPNLLQYPQVTSDAGIAAGIAPLSTSSSKQVIATPTSKVTERLLLDPGTFTNGNPTKTSLAVEQIPLQDHESPTTAADTKSQSNLQQSSVRAVPLTLNPSLHSASTIRSQSTLRPADTPMNSLHPNGTQILEDRTTDRISNNSVNVVKQKVSPSINLNRNIWTCIELLPPDYCITLRTDMVHLQLTWDKKDVTEGAAPIEPSRKCWVGVICVSPSSISDQSHEPVQLGDLDRLGTDYEPVESGAAMRVEPLWLRRGNDLLAIKFSFDDLPLEPDISG